MNFLSSIYQSARNMFAGFSEQNMEAVNITNPKFKQFEELSEEERSAYLHSVFEKHLNSAGDDVMRIGYDNATGYHNYIYGGLSTNKIQRLDSYRKMSQYTEVANAIDEICDAALNYDDAKRICKLTVNDSKIQDMKLSRVEKEFDNYINLFKLDTNYYEYMKILASEGELAWENIVDDKNKEQGIIGINYIPTESYEFLVDQKGEKKGINVTMTVDSEGQNLQPYALGVTSMNLGSANVIGAQSTNQNTYNIQSSDTSIPGQEKIELSTKKGVPMPWNQLTYIDSGTYSANRLIVYPVLERAKKAYRQLTLIEDAILIYRIVRAPVRMVFNVDIGKLPFSKGMQEVYKLMKRYQTKRVYNPITGTVSNDYDPHQMLENYWFPKAEGSTGTTVDKLDMGVNWTELPDLEYFQRKLYAALKIPFETRIKDTKVEIKRGDTYTAEDYRFAKFVMRLQDRFSIGFTKGFITHLKLTGLWEQYEMNENDIKISFTPPAAYELYQEQKLLNIKFDNYDKVTKEHPEISKKMAMKKYLGYTDIDIANNDKELIEENKLYSSLKHTATTIEQQGNPYGGPQK